MMLVGIVSAFLSVVIGAFGAHGLKKVLAPELLETFQTAVHYQAIHALALIALALFSSGHPQVDARWAGGSFVVGTLLFSGSLYAYTLTNVRAFAMVTPVGGLAFLLGWAAWGVAAYGVR